MYVKNNYFSSILYDESFMKYTKPKFKNGDRVTISKNDIKFTSLRKVYEKITSCCLPTKYSDYQKITTKRSATYIKKDLKKKKL